MNVALLTLVAGIIYITIQISNLRSPAKVEAEFMFDVADIAITSKNTRTLEKQQREKSNVVQVIFGVIASLIAALIYEYSFKLIL